MQDIKAVIFDWGKTLWDNNDPHDEKLVDGAREALEYCRNKYRLALISLTLHDTVEKRFMDIKEHGLDSYFETIEVVDTDKDAAFERIVKELNLPYEQIAIVDDRTIRGIKWGNKHGCLTIWLQRGKFAEELPNAETGRPNYTITDLKEVMRIL